MLIPKMIKDKALKLGVTSEAQLNHMVKLCAPATHDLGNRRYDNYIFLIEDKEVKDINLYLDIEEEVCPDCKNDGDFCLTCGAV